MNFIQAPTTVQPSKGNTRLVNLDLMRNIVIKETSVMFNFIRSGDYFTWSFSTKKELQLFEHELLQKVVPTKRLL